MSAEVLWDLDENEYHASPALSASGAKRLLDAPALYRHDRDNGQEARREFDIGHAAHKGVLGVGGEVVIVQKTTRDKSRVDADDYTTVSAREHRDEIRAEGKVPLLAKEKATVDAMVAAVRAHPVAGPLFADPDGRPEVSIFWDDWVRGVARRVRVDWLTEGTVVDLKTCQKASPGAFARSVADFGYDVQRVFYDDGIRAAGLGDDTDFLFVAVEKTAPHLVAVHRLKPRWEAIGRAKVDQALDLFAHCTATGEWPGYGPFVHELEPPVWLARQYEERAA